MLPDKSEVVEHRMSGESAELSRDAQHHGLRIDAFEFDLALAEIGFYARQRAEKIIIPERAAELSVGDGTKTDLFLLSDDGGDFAVLDCFQFG